jgi:hypothetical protein
VSCVLEGFLERISALGPPSPRLATRTAFPSARNQAMHSRLPVASVATVWDTRFVLKKTQVLPHQVQFLGDGPKGAVRCLPFRCFFFQPHLVALLNILALPQI